jgi:hypothetical protein
LLSVFMVAVPDGVAYASSNPSMAGWPRQADPAYLWITANSTTACSPSEGPGLAP